MRNVVIIGCFLRRSPATMATLHPFRALRPVPEKAEEVACVPYDVVNTSEALKLAEGLPMSFLHIVRPEIDLPSSVGEYADEVYSTGASNLLEYARGEYSVQDEDPSLYVYRLIMNGRSQTGIFGCVSVEDYDNDVILKHELTRPSKEDDRTRHIIEQRAHAEPVMLTFPDDERVKSIITDTVSSRAVYDLVSADGVQHTLWRVKNPAVLVKCFAEIQSLYVADGHHRCKAASRAAESLAGKEGVSNEVNFFPAVLFPMMDMRILAYNRTIKSLPGSPERFLQRLKDDFNTKPTENPVPVESGIICIYLCGQWLEISLPEAKTDSAVDALDIGRLNSYILEPMLGIVDQRRDPNIDFIGGIRGTRELERRVDSGTDQMAISMYPTHIQELVDVSDAGLLMPPKSTWFEPKLRSGFLVHLF